MKKTFPVNVNGKVFYIDEDAYQLLHDYLNQLMSAFPAPESEEIVGDIEGRISELFDERLASGASVIVYGDVSRVIEIMGSPSDISECGCDDADNHDALSSADNQDQSMNGRIGDGVNDEHGTERHLYRNLKNKVFGGVLGGIAAYMDWNANILRLFVIVICLLTYFWPLVMVYLVAWMVIPPADTPAKLLRMRGKPVTVGSVGEAVLNGDSDGNIVVDACNGISHVIGALFTGVGKILLGIVGLVSLVTALVSTGFFIFFFVALVSWVCFANMDLIETVFPVLLNLGGFYLPVLACVTMMLMSLCFVIPCAAVTWGVCSALFQVKGVPFASVLITVVLELILIVATVSCVIYLRNVGLYL